MSSREVHLGEVYQIKGKPYKSVVTSLGSLDRDEKNPYFNVSGIGSSRDGKEILIMFSGSSEKLDSRAGKFLPEPRWSSKRIIAALIRAYDDEFSWDTAQNRVEGFRRLALIIQEEFKIRPSRMFISE